LGGASESLEDADHEDMAAVGKAHSAYATIANACVNLRIDTSSIMRRRSGLIAWSVLGGCCLD
jgi:uncharacterized protein YbjQ (UPF0145 family)